MGEVSQKKILSGCHASCLIEQVQPLSAGMLTRLIWRWLTLREHASRGRLETTIVPTRKHGTRLMGEVSQKKILGGCHASRLIEQVQPLCAGMLTRWIWQWLTLREHASRGRLETTIVPTRKHGTADLLSAIFCTKRSKQQIHGGHKVQSQHGCSAHTCRNYNRQGRPKFPTAYH